MTNEDLLRLRNVLERDTTYDISTWFGDTSKDEKECMLEWMRLMYQDKHVKINTSDLLSYDISTFQSQDTYVSNSEALGEYNVKWAGVDKADNGDMVINIILSPQA